MTSADRLRGAALTLTTFDGALAVRCSVKFAEALADLFEDVAADKDSRLGTIHPRLLRVADLILGDQS